MTLQPYTLEVREWETHEGIDADVTGEEGLVEATTQVDYEDYDLMAEREEWEPSPITHDFVADVDRIEVQEVRNERNFEFRVIGDDDELARLTVTDTGWNLVHTD